MKRIYVEVFFCLLLTSVLQTNAHALNDNAEWKDITGGMPSTDFRFVISGPKNNIIYAASASGLFASSDMGKYWRKVFEGKGEYKGVNCVYIDKEDMYIAADSGLFKSGDSGRSWNRVLKAAGDDKDVLSIEGVRGVIYAGTGRGIFLSRDNGKSWRRELINQVDMPVKSIAIKEGEPISVYMVTDKGVYKSDEELRSLEKIFIADVIDDDYAEYDEDDTDEPNLVPNHLTCDKDGVLYLSASKGIFVSGDSGKSWTKFSDTGLLDRRVNHVLISDTHRGRLYAATGAGVFEYAEADGRWREMYAGMRSGLVRHLAFVSGDERIVLAAARDGIYKSVENKSISDFSPEDIVSNFDDEPSANEVQQAAIKYAEVQPEKIDGWRKGAAFRSLLPSFGVDYDRTLTYDTGIDTYQRGPFDWGMDLTWDLADLIWNPYQKDIDVRSKLMVQLRDDILDQVTRLYFERRRLQIDMFMAPDAGQKMRIEKELRLQELTASIDALTGGWFSREIAERRK